MLTPSRDHSFIHILFKILLKTFLENIGQKIETETDHPNQEAPLLYDIESNIRLISRGSKRSDAKDAKDAKDANIGPENRDK
jgi:hypothetical protein